MARIKESWELVWVDYYELLFVNINSSEQDIKKSFRELAKKYHSDNKETGDEQKFKKIGEAYEILFHSEKRKKYDIEYTKRKNIKSNKSKVSNSSSSTKANNDFNNYTREEKEIARKRAVEEAFKKEKINVLNSNQKILDAIENLLILSYSNKLNEELYQKNYNALIHLLKQRINVFITLHNEAEKLLMQNLTKEIETVIKGMEVQINEIPKSLNEAKKQVEEKLYIEEIIQFLNNKNIAIESLKNEFNIFLNKVYNRKIKNCVEYQNILQELLVKAKEHLITIESYKEKAIKYNDNNSVLYLDEFMLTINYIVENTPYDFEIAKTLFTEVRIYQNLINNLNQQINNECDGDKLVELYETRIYLLSKQAESKYLQKHLAFVSTPLEEDLVRAMGKVLYYEAKKSAIENEIQRLSSRNYSNRASTENQKLRNYQQEKTNIEKLIVEFQEKYASLLGKSTVQKYVEANSTKGNVFAQRVIEIEAELKGFSAEAFYLKKHVKLDGWVHCYDRILELGEKRIYLLSKQAELKYLQEHLASVSNPIEEDLVIANGELVYYEARKSAIEKEIQRLSSREYSNRTSAENQKLRDYQQEDIDSFIEYKRNEIEKIKKYLNFEKQNNNMFNSNFNFFDNQNQKNTSDDRMYDSSNTKETNQWNKIFK